ncbi:MAG: C10 family peptidase [Bacteroidales bacterium]
MKTIIHLIPVLLVIYSPFLHAQDVSIETAQKVAKSIYCEMAPDSLAIVLEDIQISEVFTLSHENYPVYYILNIGQDNGFVIISGQRNVKPVLGFSFESRYKETDHSPAYIYFMKNYENQIIYATENNLDATDEISNEWTRLEKGAVSNNKSILSGVPPLIGTEWGQGCKYNSNYNEDCPYCGQCGGDLCYRCAVGCVAVAMGQVMKKHEYPDYGNGDTLYIDDGSHTISADFADNRYNWFQIPDYFYVGLHHNGPELLFECGASIGMDYGQTSGATTSDVVHALKYRFNYAASARYIEKDDYNDTQWANILKNELNAGRPMVYRGEYPPFGHAWVCEGYMGNSFYMNWGWYGIDNAYYTLDDLTPDYTGGDWGDDQAAIIHIQPPDYASLPYSTGFEEGFDEYWITRNVDGYGRSRLLSDYSPHGGNYHLLMDVSQNNHYDYNQALLHLNLSGETDVELEFWWKEFNDESHSQDGIYFSDDDGSTFAKVYSLTSSTYNTWQKKSLDIDSLADNIGLSLNDRFVIKFQQYDNDSLTNDGFAFDDIEVFVPQYPDLRIVSQNVNPYTVAPGSNVTASCYVKNQGNVNASSNYLMYYLSTNWSYSEDDEYLGYDYVESLQPEASSYESELLTIPPDSEQGLYYLLFFADATKIVDESDESNNVGFFRINVIDMKSKTQVYPNPADDHFFIKLPVNDISSLVTIADIAGNPVKEIKTKQQLIKINTGDIMSGHYIIQIRILNEQYSKHIQIMH